MKPLITKRRDIRARRIIGHTATIGPVTADGQTPAEATALCERRVLENLNALDQGPIFGQLFGLVYAVTPAIDGWCTWISSSTSTYPTAYAGRIDRADALKSVQIHVSQIAWTADTDDRSFLAIVPAAARAELASWIGFQRAYIRERNAGTPEPLIHAIACERPEVIQ